MIYSRVYSQVLFCSTKNVEEVSYSRLPRFFVLIAAGEYHRHQLVVQLVYGGTRRLSLNHLAQSIDALPTGVPCAYFAWFGCHDVRPPLCITVSWNLVFLFILAVRTRDTAPERHALVAAFSAADRACQLVGVALAIWVV